MRGRTQEIIALLLKAPMTARQIQMASESFERPYGSLSVVRSDLLELTRRGWIGRQAIPTLGPGQCELLYFLKRRARQLVPELGELPKRSSIFQPVAASLPHALGVSEQVALTMRSAARSLGRVQVLDYLRDRELRCQVDARPYEKEPRLLIPDYTWLVRVDGQVQLLFVELQNRGAVISPGRDASIARSFVGKLWRYKAFLGSFNQESGVRRLQDAHGEGALPGFRVLVISTRGRKNLENLIAAAEDFQTLFYFATLDELRAANMFLDPIWNLPSGTCRSIAD